MNQWKGIAKIDCNANSTFFCFTDGQQVIDYLKINPVIQQSSINAIPINRINIIN